MEQTTITKEQFAKDVGCSIEKLDSVILMLAEKGYIRIFDYDRNGNPLEFNLNAETEQEAKELLKRFDEYEAKNK